MSKTMNIPDRDQLLHAIGRVSDAMKHLKNEKMNEAFPIGLIDMNLWEWPQGVGLYGMLQFYEDQKHEQTFEFLEQWYQARLAEGLPERNVNTCSPLITLMELAEKTGNKQYMEVCDEWSRWIMNGLIRTGDGAFQHMITGDPNDGQILIDTLFMAVMFLAKAGKAFNHPEYIEEAKKQYLIHIKYLYNTKTGLFYHGWDFNHRHNYGAVHWGRGNGWYTCGVVDFLDMIPLEPGLRSYLLDTLKSQVSALLPLQHESGLWHTVLDDPASYLETSATAAFGYGMLKGYRQGFLDSTAYEAGVRALHAVVNQVDEQGVVQNVSYGTPVGHDAQFYKDIAISPMTYGQSLAQLILIEGLKHT